MTEASPNDDLATARDHYDSARWDQAYLALTRVDGREPLDIDDLERLAWSAGLTSRDREMVAALDRVHQACVASEQCARAARAAFWAGMRLMGVGKPAAGGGWLARAQRLVEGEAEDCPMRGYMMLPQVMRQLVGGDHAAAAQLAGAAAALGDRVDDPDLAALGRSLEGRALLRNGEVESGLACIDETMIAVTSGAASPIVTGLVYCQVIATCHQILAIDRAREFTAALARWCAPQPGVTFAGSCRVHRSEILQVGGDWPSALDEVATVCDDETIESEPDAYAGAWYQRAELMRLRGDFDAAEAAYRHASEHGREPQPGLALLRLAQGQTGAAVNAIRRVLATTDQDWARVRYLPACVDILLAAGAVDDAREVVSELEKLSERFEVDILAAIARHTRGALRLAEGDAQGAVAPLRSAFQTWQKARAPYLAARIRVLIARAYDQLGDTDSAALERAGARTEFERLGARPDLEALDERPAKPSHGLSPRELEVLTLVAAGNTNREIAGDLALSERTIDRHVSNIFTKLDVNTRAAATAFAYKNKLL